MTAETEFPLLGEPLAVDLVNTVVASGGRLVDLLETPEGLRAWLAAEAARLPGAAAAPPPALAEVRRLREALRVLLRAALAGGEPDAAAVAAVNAASAAVGSHPELAWAPGEAPRLLERLAPPAGPAAVLAAIARSGIELLGGPDRERLRACGGPGCVLLFVADNPRRQWCSPSLCGNRVRVARHYRRHRVGPADPGDPGSE
jgi:predicted RNA-binding Zn ribbon-like protein